MAGRRNASVFPDPVAATATRSRPDMAIGLPKTQRFRSSLNVLGHPQCFRSEMQCFRSSACQKRNDSGQPHASGHEPQGHHIAPRHGDRPAKNATVQMIRPPKRIVSWNVSAKSCRFAATATKSRPDMAIGLRSRGERETYYEPFKRDRLRTLRPAKNATVQVIRPPKCIVSWNVSGLSGAKSPNISS